MHNTLRKRTEEIKGNIESLLEEIEISQIHKVKGDQKEFIDYVKSKSISTQIWFTDFLGNLKVFSIRPSELKKAFEQGMGFDGSSIEGYRRIHESDMVALPLIETAQLLPFQVGGSPTIRMFAQIRSPDESLYECDPRNILIENLKKLKKHGITQMNVGPEAEYFYFRDSESTEPLDNEGYFDMSFLRDGDNLRQLTIFALESMDIPVEYEHHEVAPSQHEIDLKYKDALTMADNLITYKWLVKEIASRAGVHATFMPKPLASENGSGMHIHVSYWNKDNNVMFDEGQDGGLSEITKHIIGGIKHNIRGITLILNQWENSFKRLVPGCEAPVYIAWARRNRSALIRIPEYRPGKEEATRIELRSPDAACNPYLAFSVIIGASIDGIEHKRSAGEELTFDLYEGIERKRAEERGIQIESLPRDLCEAVEEAEKSEVLRNTIGEDVLSKLIETKKQEVFDYRQYISEKEKKDGLKL